VGRRVELMLAEAPDISSARPHAIQPAPVPSRTRGRRCRSKSCALDELSHRAHFVARAVSKHWKSEITIGRGTRGKDLGRTRVDNCYRIGRDQFVELTIPISSLPAHRAHGDIVPGVDTAECGCPGMVGSYEQGQ
jgi:hypothetical protein